MLRDNPRFGWKEIRQMVGCGNFEVSAPSDFHCGMGSVGRSVSINRSVSSSKVCKQVTAHHGAFGV